MRKFKIGKVVLTDGGVWNATTGYPILTFVRHNGDGWWSFKANVNSEPSAGNPNWIQATDTQSLQEAMREAIADVEALNRAMQEAESIRTSAEEERNEAENKRNDAEHGRMDAESLRDRNEELRKSGESTRDAAERRRDAEESARIMAERGRAAAETARETASAAAIEQANQAVGIANAAAQEAHGSAEYANEQGDYAKMEGGKIAPAIAQMNETFVRNEAQREQRVNTAVEGANTAADNANRAMENIEAPKDGKIYGRKNGSWVPSADENLEKKTTYLLHLFGQYATPAPQSLEIDPTRKDVAISAESMSEVAAEGWAISQPIVIRKGNIYRIKVGEASGQYVTTAMRYQYRDEQGNLRYAYKRKTQLDEHSELPVDGYLIMYGLPRDYELVVCFKYTADYDPVVEVLTAGLLRTLAFQLGDMQDMIDQKLDVNGHSSAASVGGAMALLQKGDVPEDTYSELLTARMIGNAPDLMHVKGSTDTRTGIDDGKDVNVVVEKVWGDVVVGNQLVDLDKQSNTVNGLTITYNKEEGYILLNGTPTTNTMFRFLSNNVKAYPQSHTYFVLSPNLQSGRLIVIDFNTITEFSQCKKGGKFNFASDYPLMRAIAGNTFDNEKVYISFVDLHATFVADTSFVDNLYDGVIVSNLKDDAIKVAHRLGFAAFTLD